MVEITLWDTKELDDYVLSKSQSKKFIKKYTETKIRKRNDRLLNDEEQNFKFYSIDELEELPKVNWLIDKVFPTIGLGTIYGDSGE